MSILTRRPGGGWTNVSPPGNYSAVVADYRGSIQAAQLSAKNTELESKIFEYKQGRLSFGELAMFLNASLAAETPGSQRELDIRQLIAEVQKFEDGKNRDIKRSTLEAKFAKGGISAEERLQIEEELLGTYKEGTPEHTEQLNIIATAQELATVEENNAQLARIQAELSQGGLSTEEAIQLYQEARDLTESGSEERAQIDEKINLLKEDLRVEKQEQARNDRAVELLEQFGEGGLSLEEELTINRELQKLTDEGTPEMLKLKQDEAAILGDIADRGKGDAGAAAEAQFIGLEAKAEQLQADFAEGRISDTEFQAGRNEILTEQERIIGGLGDVELTSEAAAARTALDEEIRRQEAGETITIIDPRTGEREIRPVGTEFLRDVITEEEVGRFEIDEKTGEGAVVFDPDPDSPKKNLKTQVIEVASGGQRFKVALNAEGQFETLVERDGKLVRSGSIFDPKKQREILAAGKEEPGVPTVPGVTPISESRVQREFEVPEIKPVKPAAPVVGAPRPSFVAKEAPSLIFAGLRFRSAKDIKEKVRAGTDLTRSFLRSVSKPGAIRGTREFGITERLGLGSPVKRFQEGFGKVKSFFSGLFDRED